MEPLRVLAMSGSLRTESYNRKALQIAKRIAENAGVEVREADLRDLALPIYDGDIEAQGLPGSVRALKAAVEAAAVLLIASPEYNYSVSGALKNAIDWLSRGGNSLNGKAAAIFGASTGAYGTLRGQQHLRQMLQALNVLIFPQPQVFIRNAQEAFTEDGKLRDAKTHELLERLVRETLAEAQRRVV